MIRIAILNNYLSTFGGGEKNTYALANVISKMGFSVDVLTFESKVPSNSEIDSFYGPDHSGFCIRTVPGGNLDENGKNEELTKFLRPYSVFINQTAASSFPNPCPLGIYFVMFPFQAAGKWLETYAYYICNSEFTRFYTSLQWGASLHTKVIYPCVEKRLIDENFSEREPEILSIGRFCWDGHAKNQDLLVDAFERILPSMPGWRLTLLGRVHDDADTLKRMETLRERCKGLPIRFELNVSDSDKIAALRRASIFWHGTGIGKQEPRDASKMEHFGIAVLEAMLFGVIPMCFHRGGPREIIRHGESGFLFCSFEELQAFSVAVVNNSQLRKRMSQAAAIRANDFSRARFDSDLRVFFSNIISLPTEYLQGVGL